MANKERIFIALRPDVTTCKELFKIQQQVRVRGEGRVIPPENLHLTLASLGDCDSQRKQCILDRINEIEVPPFDIWLENFDYFSNHHIFYIAPHGIPAGLQWLREQIYEALIPCHFQIPPDFKPHIALFRDVRSTPFYEPLVPSLRWHVHTFCINRSEYKENGAHYTTLKEYSLVEEIDIQPDR